MFTSLLWTRKKIVSMVNTPIKDFESDIRRTASLNIAPWQIPHDSKKDKGGEDSYFISADGSVIGIFDGVGGWADSGIDPRDYSYVLSEGCRQGVEDALLTDPLTILNYGYKRSLNIMGSSTACILTIKGSAFDALNVGDSGFRIVRDNHVVYGSKEQQHSFNLPYQLGPSSNDQPEHGDSYKYTLKDGDIVIVGTDGLFDNLYDDAIISLLNKKSNAQEMAQALSREAYSISKSHSANTPFSRCAQQAGYYFQGGKEDDITVIVAQYKDPSLTAKL
jgi:protein phosphatase PTC7